MCDFLVDKFATFENHRTGHDFSPDSRNQVSFKILLPISPYSNVRILSVFFRKEITLT